MASFSRGGIQDVVDITLFNIATGKPVIHIDSLKMLTAEKGTETVYARGGSGNPKRVAWDVSRNINILGKDCMVSASQLATLAGTSVSSGTQYVPITDVVKITSGSTVTLSSEPYRSDLTNYPMSVYTNVNNDGTSIGEEIAYSATPSADEYSVSGTTVTFGKTYTDQKFIITYYKPSSINNKRVVITSDQFPATFKLTGYTLWKDQSTGESHPCLITIHRAKLLASFSITQEAAGQPSSFTMAFAVLKNIDDKTMIYYDVLEESVESSVFTYDSYLLMSSDDYYFYEGYDDYLTVAI